MIGYWEWGIDAVLWLQGHVAALQPAMRVLSFLGTTEFLLLFGLTVYWCVDARAGVRLGLLLVAGAALGGLLKLAFHMPRPYWMDARIQAPAGEATYGMPSVHALYAWAVAPWIGWEFRRGWGLAAGVFLAVGVSLSRVCLGVHFPGDVAAGLAAGFLVWFAVDLGIRRLGPLFMRAGFAVQCLAAVAVSGLLLGLQAAILRQINPLPDPAAWAENAARISLIFPRNPNHIVSLAGLIAGMGLGLVCKERWAPMDAGGGIRRRILRFLLGFFVTLLLWGGLAVLWNEPAQPGAYWLRYLRYGLVGLWMVFAAPWVFLRWGLADRAR